MAALARYPRAVAGSVSGVRTFSAVGAALIVACGVALWAPGSATAATKLLRPNGDVVRQWRVVPGGSASGALAEQVEAPGAPDRGMRIEARRAGRPALLNLSYYGLSPTETVRGGALWFHGRTNDRTRLRVQVLWDGKMQARRTLDLDSPGWHHLGVRPPTQSAITTMQVRFTALSGAGASVAAAYARLRTGVGIPAGNLTENPSFEHPVSDEWGAYLAALSRALDPTAPDGAHAIRVDWGGTGADGYAFGQTPPGAVVAGRRYLAGARVRAGARQRR